MPQRKVFAVVDGILGGEGDGPLAPNQKHCGTIICSMDPLLVDKVGTKLWELKVMFHTSIRMHPIISMMYQ